MHGHPTWPWSVDGGHVFIHVESLSQLAEAVGQIIGVLFLHHHQRSTTTNSRLTTPMVFYKTVFLFRFMAMLMYCTMFMRMRFSVYMTAMRFMRMLFCSS